ncbi:MAG TPA: hypothetical protein VNL92_01755, partial [Dehalococcoidia bacterium]|nr:hypothetical protein [Dehalococcoidia bacterium]
MNGQERWNARYEGWKRRRMSRRTALRGVTIGGVGAAAAATIGCGDDDDDDDDAEAPGAGAS